MDGDKADHESENADQMAVDEGVEVSKVAE